MESRSLTLFKNSLETEATKQSYLYWLRRYSDYTKMGFDELTNRSVETINKELEDLILSLRSQNIKPSTIKAHIYPLIRFYVFNDKQINKEKLKRLLPKDNTRPSAEGYKNHHVQDIIHTLGQKQKLRTYRNKAIFHLLASSGCRVGAIPGMKLADVRKMGGLFSVKIYARSQSEYLGFLTPEASEALAKYLEKRESIQGRLKPDSSLFDVSYSAVRAMITRTVKKANVSTKKNNGRFNIPSAHGFRKRYNTILKSNDNHNYILVERLLGHNIGLDASYYEAKPELLLKEYKKGSKHLTISNQELVDKILD